MIGSYVDAEAAVADWASNNGQIRTAVSKNRGNPNIYIGGIPKWMLEDSSNTTLKNNLPMIVLYRAGGNPEPDIDVPIDYPRISFSCWAGNRLSAQNLANALIQASMSVIGGTHFGSTAVCQGASVLSMVWLPDPALDLSRYSVDITFTVQVV